ncbi:AMP-binding protein [Timonella sp. A28]|uniref:AMP-binding protein n=1 Tax=Timonella sp. A28 TaxID=3442640 RepID=UPI003EB73475
MSGTHVHSTGFTHSYTYDDVEKILSSHVGHVVVSTSGSTGTAKSVVVSTRALKTSGEATHRALSGPGQWLLTLPTHHIAGIQVLSRSALAGHRPVSMPKHHTFSGTEFIHATEQLSASTTYTSLVPTQLHRLLTPSPEQSEAIAALQSYSAILLGGAAASTSLLEMAHRHNIPVHTTYGMSETAGGCVYSGTPLDITRVHITADNRIHIAGPMLADGYLSASDTTHTPLCTAVHTLADTEAFYTDAEGTRWHRTNDLGQWNPTTHTLDILGRADDIIISGGLKISPTIVENALTGSFGIIESCAVGIPDSEWGQRLVALVTTCADSEIDPITHIREVLTSNLGKEYGPREIHVVSAIPTTATGKHDRIAATQLATHLSTA